MDDEFGKEIKDATAYLDQGALSDLIPTQKGFLLAYVEKKQLGDEKTELPPLREQIANNIAQNKASLLVASWRKELLKEANFEDLLPRKNDDS